MPVTTATLTAQLAALDNQIAVALLGERVDQGGGASITQQNLDKLYSRRNIIQTQLDRATGARPGVTRGTVVGQSAPPSPNTAIPADLLW